MPELPVGRIDVANDQLLGGILSQIPWLRIMLSYQIFKEKLFESPGTSRVWCNYDRMHEVPTA